MGEVWGKGWGLTEQTYVGYFMPHYALVIVRNQSLYVLFLLDKLETKT